MRYETIMHKFDEIEKENLLLRKEHELILRQSDELKQEVSSLQRRFDSMEKISDPTTQRFSIKDFAELSGDGTSKLLINAMKYAETHSGCPFYHDHCQGNDECGGVWVYLGSPCWTFVDRIKRAKTEDP
jgi:hypothetical protein